MTGSLVEKLRGRLLPKRANNPVKAASGSPEQRETSTNAQPEGASDEPWPKP